MKLFKPHWNIKYIVSRIFDILYKAIYPNRPNLTRGAIRFLESRLSHDIVGLEWGSGRSTVWFAKRIKSLTSVEHNPFWYKRVSGYIKDNKLSNIKLVLFEDSDPYVSAAGSIANNSLDFVLIDGRWRGDCLNTILDKVRSGGILVIDDSQRYLPLGFKAVFARKVSDGPREDFVEPYKRLREWELIRTCNGVKDTTIWIKPTKVNKV